MAILSRSYSDSYVCLDYGETRSNVYFCGIRAAFERVDNADKSSSQGGGRVVRLKALKERALTGIGVTVFALCLGLSVSARASQISPLTRILHVTRLWRAGDEGQGVRVGVISGGIRNYQVLARRGILPSTIVRFDRDGGQGDEGDWMLQVVYDIAPRAQLAFCPGGAPSQTVACARRLIERFHAAIVVDDINPQPVSFAPTAKAQGYARLLRENPHVLFFTGAGNNGGGYYEGAWHPLVVTEGGRRYAAQTFGASAHPYESLRVGPWVHAVVLVGINILPRASGRCARDGTPTHLEVTNRHGRVLAQAIGTCPVIHLRLRNEQPRIAHWRIWVLRPHRRWPRGAIKLVAIRTGLGVSPLALSDHTAGGAGNSATVRGIMAIAALDPGSGDHGQYFTEPYANSGPQCLDYTYNAEGVRRLLPPVCFRQPVFATPDKTRVAMPADNGRGYAWRPFSGDSAAGPAAAGVAALLLADHVPAARIEALLKRTARPQGSELGWSPRTGYGLVDADAAAVAAGVLASRARPIRHRLIVWHAGRAAFREDRALVSAAQAGDRHAAQEPQGLARAGEPLAQSLLGTLYNRGWGVTLDPRAAHIWWTRAAHQGVENAIYNLGITWAMGRGATPNPMMGYALMRAAQERGLSFPPMRRALHHIRTLLSARVRAHAERLARRFAADPARIP